MCLVHNYIRSGLYCMDFCLIFLFFLWIVFFVGIDHSIFSSARYNNDIWFRYIVSTLIYFSLAFMFCIAFLAIADSS